MADKRKRSPSDLDGPVVKYTRGFEYPDSDDDDNAPLSFSVMLRWRRLFYFFVQFGAPADATRVISFSPAFADDPMTTDEVGFRL